MNIKKEFNNNPEIEVSASQIGISKWSWISINSDDQNKAKRIMGENRFDVLPVENNKKEITSFFVTQEWNNYSNLNRINIKDAKTIYYRTSLKDLIKKFKDDESHYYFLSDNEHILGLVSYVNLNSQIVYNYLFFVLADIEKSVSQILKNYITQDEIRNEFEKSKDKQILKLVADFNKNIKSNNDNDIFQHMYLQTVGVTLKKFLNKLPYEYKKLGKFANKFGAEGVYNLIRRKVMHPVRPILSDKESINQIDELLTDYNLIKDITENTLISPTNNENTE